MRTSEEAETLRRVADSVDNLTEALRALVAEVDALVQSDEQAEQK